MFRNAFFAIVAFLLGACATAPAVYEAGAPCEAASFTLTDGFAGARRGNCEVLAGDHVRVSILPEDEGYINPSPWYSFRVFPKRQGPAVITINYVGGEHRYVPKISFDGQSWTPLDEQRTSITDDGTAVDIELQLTGDPFWISAQALVTPDVYDVWTREMAERSTAAVKLLGQSLNGRPMLYLETDAVSENVLLLIGRQHPPEVSGAFAFFSFMETLLGGTELANGAVPLCRAEGRLKCGLPDHQLLRGNRARAGYERHCHRGDGAL